MPFCNLRVMATLLHSSAPHDDPQHKKHGRFGLLRKSKKRSVEKLPAAAPVLPQLPIFDSETEKRKEAKESRKLEADPAEEWLSEKPLFKEKERVAGGLRESRPKTPDVDLELRRHLRDEGMAFLAFADFGASAQEEPTPFEKAVSKPVHAPARTPSTPREVKKETVEVEVEAVEVVEKKSEVIMSTVEIPYAGSSRSASVVDIPAKKTLKKEEPAKKEKAVLKKEESPKEKQRGFFGRLSRKKSREVAAEPTPVIPTEPVPAVPVAAGQPPVTPAPAPVEEPVQLQTEQPLVTASPEKKLEESLQSATARFSPAPVSAPTSTLEADISASNDSKDGGTPGTQRDSGLELDSDVSAGIPQEPPKPRRPRSDSREMARHQLEGRTPGKTDPRAMHRDAHGPPPHPRQGRPLHHDRRHSSQMRPGPHPNVRRHSGLPPHGRPPHGPRHLRPPLGSGYPISGNVSKETIPELEETPTQPRRSQSENRAPKRPAPPPNGSNPKIHISRPSNTSLDSLDSRTSSLSSERASFTIPPPLMLPPTTDYTAEIKETQLHCEIHHRQTIVSSNQHHRIMCMVCTNNTSAERHLCTYCALRFCVRCRNEFQAGRTIPEIRERAEQEDWRSDDTSATTASSNVDSVENISWAIASALEEPAPSPPRNFRLSSPSPPKGHRVSNPPPPTGQRRPRPPMRPHSHLAPPEHNPRTPRKQVASPARRPRPRPEEYADITASIPRFDGGPYAHAGIARPTSDIEFALPAELERERGAKPKNMPKHLAGFI